MRDLAFWASTAAISIFIAACGGGGNGSGGGGAGGAGSSGGGVPCGDNPLECPAGQTCWFAPDGGFECEPSGAGKEGETCAPLKGQPTCGDGLLCFKPSGQEGVCAPLCNTGIDTCGAGKLCTPVQVASGEQTHVCH